jgi:hypothetical protein
VLAQALQLGEKEIQVTAYDYSGNTATTTIPVTIVDFQMPVCEGWNLRSTWLTLENNSWEDIIATTDAGNINSLLRWSGQNQRWEYYAGTGSTAGWYYGGSRVTSALMVPLEAYWLHALKSDQFGLVTLRQVTAPPTRQMYAGWNLAGAALAWDQPMLYASDGLVSIYQDATGNTGYTNVVSIHQHIESEEDYYICGTYEEGSYDTYFQQWNWVLTTSPGGDGGPPVFLTRGGGYWIFMQNEAVLAGFSTTPLTEAFWSHWYD